MQGKASLARRNSHIGVSRTNNRGEASPTTSARQRRKSGVISAAAIKRWEKKAAMPGVSLVADVAEHLERTTGGNEKELAGSSDAVHIIKINKQNEQQSAWIYRDNSQVSNSNSNTLMIKFYPFSYHLSICTTVKFWKFASVMNSRRPSLLQKKEKKTLVAVWLWGAKKKGGTDHQYLSSFRDSTASNILRLCTRSNLEGAICRH